MAELTLYRTREEILAEMLVQLQGVIPDIYVGEDGVVRIIFNIEAGQFENIFLANQLVLQDMFVSTASLQALKQHGLQHNVALKEGTRSLGTVTFDGEGGTYIPLTTSVGYDPGGGLEPIYFDTIVDGTLPNPGTPVPPVAALNATAGNLTGTYEYVVTFVTASGETLPSPESNAVVTAAQRINLSAIPLGGAGTTARRIYRDKNGAGVYRRVAEIADNTTTVYADNVLDATVAASSLVPDINTANRLTLAAEAEAPGVEGNVGIGTITELVSAPASLTSVTNPIAFTGGSDQEDTEEFRQRLLERLRNPQTGSPPDLKSWAEAVPGVETATVFANDNLGVATNGHTTIRIAGPDGSIPGAAVIAAVAAALAEQDFQNMTIHVATFVPQATAVTVDVTTSGTYVLADVTPAVQAAISDYINSLQVGETLRLAGIVDAVFGLPGIADVTVSVPATNLTTAATDKRTPGTITVT
jgi:uncharacterized phage protein gp47/JayE